MTVYPEDFDTDLEIPRVDKNVSEISGEAINSLRDAIFALQKTLGISIQGNKPSLGDRVSVSIDANGLIKKKALENIGLVTLPIDNRHVGINAGILEVKLDLDYPTSGLNNSINSLRTDVDGIANGVSGVTANFNLHILGQGNFHDGYHIKVNLGSSEGIAGLEATTIGDAMNELSKLLIAGDKTTIPHMDLNLPSSVKHLAADISVNTTNFVSIDRSVADVQEAFDDIDAKQGALGISHVDEFHSNGILKQISSGTDFNPRQNLLDAAEGSTYTLATSIIKIPNVTSFSALGITTGNILQIVTQSGIADVGSYQIRAVGPLVDAETLGDLPVLDVDELALFHTFSESRETADKVKVNIYKAASAPSELAPLACIVRNNETIVDTISIMPPNAARAVTLGFNGEILNVDGYSIGLRASLGDGRFRNIIIPDLNLERLNTNQAEPVDAKSVAERINAYVSDPDLGHHFPITAYRIGNELAIAHNLVGGSYTVEVRDGYSGNFALGLDAYGSNVVGKVLSGNDNNAYSVNGIASSSIRTVLDGYGRISSSTSTLMLWNTAGTLMNPLVLGLTKGSVIHITDHPTQDTNGSYTLFSSNSTSVSLFSSETIDAPATDTTFTVKVTDANVSLEPVGGTETDQGIVQIAIDANGKTLLHERLFYGTNLGSGVEILNVSESFPVGDISVLVGLDFDFINFNIIDDTLAGATGRVHETFRGSFKLYHPNNLDFFVVRMVPGVIPGGIEVVSVNEPLVADEVLRLCSGHFNGTSSVTSLVDTRLFGNMGFNEVRDDFIEVFSRQPVSDLRSDGVARGFDLLDIPFFDSVTSMEALPIQGGIAYVNGVRVAVETQKVRIQSFNSEGTLNDNARRVVGVNEFGSIQVLSDEFGEILHDGYNASAAFGKVLPLYHITLNEGGIDEVIDVRLFINNIDDKIELVVDETNNVVGNFRTLEGALLYADKYPGREKLTIRILNTLEPTRQLVVPSGVSIQGTAPYGGNGKHRILNNYELATPFIVLKGNNKLENITVESSLVALSDTLVSVDGGNIVIDKCLFKFGEDIGTNSDDLAINLTDNARDNVLITRNIIDNVYTGISSSWGCENLVVSDNIIRNLSGTGGTSHGIFVSTLSRPTDVVTINRNIVKVPSIAQGADIRGISIDIREAVDIARITHNTVLHEAENTMTNGIRVSSEQDGGTGNLVKQLFISDNHIQGVKLDDNNVYGIYVNDITNASIYANSILRCGVTAVNRSDVAGILIGDRVTFTEIHHNSLKDCDLLRGIHLTNSTGRGSIIGNIIEDIGTDAHYIRGSAPWTNISENTITGPGEIGIHWSGARTKITSNLMNAKSATDYAFEQYGISISTSDLDISNNTITDMRFSGSTDNSKVISSDSNANDRIKIVGNTLSGDKVFKYISLQGEDHVVSHNKIFNVSLQTSPAQATLGIQLDTVSNSLINGNTFDGVISAGITSSATPAVSLTIINNNVVATTITTSSVKLDGTTTDCIVMGNRMPNGGSESNRIGALGASLSPTVFNDNLIGMNFGLEDTVSLPGASGIPSYETISPALYGGAPHWAMKDTNDYWEINRAAFTGARILTFPISALPNGAKLNSVHINGRSDTPNAMTGQIFKRSVKSVDGSGDLIVTAVSSLSSLPTGLGTTDFGTTNPTSEVTALTAGGEIINHIESNYFLRISHTETSPTNPDKIRIYGITINFTY